MDNFDIEILRLLQIDSRISTEKIGAKIGLSASACQRRIKKLKENGIIQKEIAVIDKTNLPGFITVILDIYLEKGGEVLLDSMINQLNSEPQIQQVYYVSGEVDLVVIATCQNMNDYDLLSRKLFMSNKNIKRFNSKIVIQPLKASTNLPL